MVEDELEEEHEELQLLDDVLNVDVDTSLVLEDDEEDDEEDGSFDVSVEVERLLLLEGGELDDIFGLDVERLMEDGLVDEPLKELVESGADVEIEGEGGVLMPLDEELDCDDRPTPSSVIVSARRLEYSQQENSRKRGRYIIVQFSYSLKVSE